MLASLIFGFFVFGFVNGAFAVLPMFTMKYGLAPDRYEWHTSVFTVAIGFGLLAGSVIGTLVSKKIKPHFLMSVPILIAGFLIFLLGYTNVLWVYYATAFVLGMCIGPVNIAIGGWMPKIVHPKLMGRVSGWQDPFMMFAQSMTLGLVALLFPKIVSNIDYLYYGMGAVILLVFIFYFIALPKFSAQAAEIDVQEKLGTQRKKRVKSVY